MQLQIAQWPVQYPFEQNLRCQLCNNVCQETEEIQTLERNLNICFICSQEINETFITTFSQNYIHHYAKTISLEPYCYQAQFKYQKNIKLYDLQRKECVICYQNQICTKICGNNHYCCCNCLKTYIAQNLDHEIKCVMENCDQHLDHFLVFGYIPFDQIYKWSAINYTLFCCNPNCTVQLILKPYTQIHGNIPIKLLLLCNCWSEHTGPCTIQNEKLFKEYCKKNKVLNCPKCHILSQPQICQQSQTNQQIQHCPLCKSQFCAHCNSLNINLFPCQQFNSQSEGVYLNMNCHKCSEQYSSKSNRLRRFCQKHCGKDCSANSFLIGCCSILVFILFLPGYQFLQVGKLVSDFVEDTVLKTGKSKASCTFCCCGPFIAIFIIASILILYVILFIPLFFKNCRDKINGKQI